MPRTSWGWEITREELAAWIIEDNPDLLVVNKPALVLCHPSKHGPWSSLVGACREYLGLERLHMPSRLDRETSGVVVLAKNAALASVLQRGAELGQVRKVYYAVLCGELSDAISVDQPIGDAAGAAVVIRRAVVEGGQASRTDFQPIEHRDGYTLTRVVPHTGRLHQIRVHASWLGYPIAGDKIYGPDEQLFLEFLVDGWTESLAAKLPLDRQALHCGEWHFESDDLRLEFRAPLPSALWPPSYARP